MRDTVDKILRNEAERLHDKSKDKGLMKEDLTYLNALIHTYKTFIGESVAGSPPEPPPEEQSTAQLLASLSTPTSKKSAQTKLDGKAE